ncbi:MAG TPA: enoyl-CoA hydratase/isomerase family protein, partial [Chloroflexota bacterium]|nr:enoyl-CoA hydratase/isomerase family protein [Chloroflexota bacterium]
RAKAKPLSWIGEMAYQFLNLCFEDGVATLVLSRPSVLNAWNEQMRGEMGEAVRSLVHNHDLRVLIITGEGRAFSAGEDVRDMKTLADVDTRRFRRVARDIHNVFDEIEALEAPVIAALNGVAAGGGLELALSCDFRIASEAAKLGFPETNVGLIPGSGGCSRLVRLVGLAHAKRLVMTGEMIPAQRALELGLVEEVVPADHLLPRVEELARQLAAKAPLALGLAKLVLNACLTTDPQTGRNLERLGQSILKKTEDHVEGVQAFMEKRKPEFRGR